MPPMGFVHISLPQEEETEILPKRVPVATHDPPQNPLHQETELVLPPQHIWTLLKKG